MSLIRSAGALALAAIFTVTAPASAEPRKSNMKHTSDRALVDSLPGFSERYAEVNGVRLHYVVGGKGPLIVLLPGWPQTWWAYHKIMPELAVNHRVVSVDIRGMGASEKPDGGYDKRTMADDLSALIRELGEQNADVVGHDIGAMVAFSLAANHPEQVRKLVMLDVAHPSAGYLRLSLLPTPGTFGDKLDEDHPYLWWFAFHQVKGLPELLLEGRAGLEHAWFFKYMAKDEAAIDAHDRAVYASAYSSRDAIRASNGWYQAFGQDIADDARYEKLSMPVLGLGGPGYPRLKAALDAKAPGSQTFKIEGSGHFIAEEKPAALVQHLLEFLGK
ncbi:MULTISPECIES: alpha/beta fold hydrolase [unclassified Bradyrhizobium]|uniref:alpha/beta fold hydrolase n=1 Tax=unclassified Bradyrhizobium TaxID=2631580 RepID=UPI002304EE96|nr:MULTISPECIES: alpha/beta hydrolase [unclassified Bradyrhizobium]MDA9451245.1 alpha/beta hydrolase [Bradyrhizobium sp. CCBAU 21360]MDA9457624.1 alpha/beta hydrolase [Bradyrhizobium sp. CCBAU 21359]